MNETADVAIIGAGVLGVSAAYHLAKRGAGKIVILERNDVGSGSTSQSGGGIRHQFSGPTGVEMTRHSMRVFERFRDEFGVDLPLHRSGYLYVIQTEQQLAAFRQNVQMQREHGVDVSLLSRDEVAERFPYVNTDDLLGGSYSPDDGYSDPQLCVSAMAARARELGAEIRTGQEVVRIDRSADRVIGITTTGGRVDAPAVVIAAGPWSGQVGDLAGVQIPVVPRRREQFTIEPFPLSKLPETPYILDPQAGVTIHREGQAIDFGSTLRLPSTFDTTPNPGAAPDVLRRASHRIPALVDAPIARVAAGILEVTPDHNGIISDVPGLGGLYVLAGFSGHGFMHAPIAGQLMAELIADGRAHTIDVSSYALDRFGKGEMRVDATSPFH